MPMLTNAELDELSGLVAQGYAAARLMLHAHGSAVAEREYDKLIAQLLERYGVTHMNTMEALCDRLLQEAEALNALTTNG